MMPSFRDQLVHQLQCEGAFTEQAANELADAYRGEVLAEANTPDTAKAIDFFQPGHAYHRANPAGEKWEFRVVAVTRCPVNTLQAIGWLTRLGTDVWHPSSRGTLAWVRDGWTDVTEVVAS
ncbi:hypothetical protein [Streptomyces spinosirectus]